MSLYIGLQYKLPLGGIISFSGFYPFPTESQKYIKRTDVPVFLSQGKLDPIIITPYFKKTCTILQSNNVPIHTTVFDPNGEHCITPYQFDEFQKFLQSRL
uniref:palmitoyl-protein hydrolase n=1 Tax=Lygus hesperus TaxID=30085 RepID=A0A0A9X103_LYGHE